MRSICRNRHTLRKATRPGGPSCRFATCLTSRSSLCEIYVQKSAYIAQSDAGPDKATPADRLLQFRYNPLPCHPRRLDHISQCRVSLPSR